MDKKKILIVDDDEAILRSLKEFFELKGYDVDTAEDGETAIAKSKDNFYNLALLDVRLPNMEGTKLLTKLYKNTPKMMTIMVTGYPALENAVEALNLGADAYVTKPVNPVKLLKIVEEKLKEQEEADKMSEEKVAEWIKTRVRKLTPKQKTRSQPQH